MRDILNSDGVNVYVNSVSAREPLDLITNDNTSSTMTIKGLNGFGTGNQLIKTNTGATELEYMDNFGGTAPIVITGSTISYDISRKIHSSTCYHHLIHQISQCGN